MRTFIAIDLNPEIKARISDLVRRLKRLDSGKIGWVKETGMHLTLKFLGEIDEGQAESVKSFLREVSGTAKSFGLSVKGTGFFPPAPKSPRVLWAGIVEQPHLLELQDRIESGLEKLGFSRESRPFHPHLTLGRVRSAAGLSGVLAELGKWKDFEFGEMTIRRFILMKSTLLSTGAEYSSLEEFPLS
jgi:2'-5' RNA ligase